jgi:alanyl-tRNA synthetase
MTERIYFEDAYRREFDARVRERRTSEGRPALVLDRTGFYPEAGGQPCDLGTIEGVEVVQVIEDGEDILHVLKAPVAADAVRGAIDWERRFDHMQQHTGQHILSQAFVEVLRGETKSFHLGAGSSTLEIGIGVASDESLDRVERRANRVVFEDRPVTTRFVPPGRIAEVPLRRPPKVEGVVRVVEVDGFDWSACGGTHCRRTGEVGLIKIVGWDKIRGNLRFSFVCGGRALAEFQARNRVVRDLTGRFNVPAGEVPAAVERLGAEAKEAKRRLKKIEETLAGYEAGELVAKAEGRLVRAVLAERGPDAARALALAVVRKGEFIALIGAKSASRSHLILARSELIAVDLRPLAAEIASLMNGKGGGGPSLVEIAGDAGADLEAVLNAAAARLKLWLG